MTLLVFPTLIGVGYPVNKSPQWSTEEYRSTSGKRTTLGHFVYPFYNIELTYEVLRSDIVNLEWQTLLAFFNSVGGKRDLWQFNDPDDNTATTMQFGTGDGATNNFQLTRTITGTGGLVWADPIFFPTITTIFDNTTPLASPANYTVNSTGLVSFVVAPVTGHNLNWTGTWKWGCRFDIDTIALAQFAHNFWELKKINFSTEKL